MPRSFMIFNMVSVDTCLRENSLLISNYCYCFYTLVKGKCFHNGVNCVIEVYPR